MTSLIYARYIQYYNKVSLTSQQGNTISDAYAIAFLRCRLQRRCTTVGSLRYDASEHLAKCQILFRITCCLYTFIQQMLNDMTNA